MNAPARSPADYGNWIRGRIVLAFYGVGLLMAAAGLALGLVAPGWRWLLVAPAAVPIGIGLYLSYLYRAFSERGGGVQGRLWALVVDHLPWDGRGAALDVGTGQGALAIRLAERFAEAKVTGVDLWAADWAYSKAACERNAERRGVEGRTDFQRASASDLPFADGSMDAVVSHFVFHEVGGPDGPRQALREAIRVLKPSGVFSFQDMFLDRRFYGEPEALLADLSAWGLEDITFIPLPDLMPIPWGMGGRRVLGCAGLIHGTKAGA